MPTMLKSERQLKALLREAERELDAATRRSALNAAARRFMQAKAALKNAEKSGSDATRPAASRGAAKAGAS